MVGKMIKKIEYGQGFIRQVNIYSSIYIYQEF